MKITKVKSKLLNRNYYSLDLVINNKNSFNGTYYFVPQINDIIEYNKNKINVIYLPNNIDDQKQRITDLDLNISDFEKYEYGENFWINIYRDYNEINNIDGLKHPDNLNKIYYHISNYIDAIISYFRKSLIDDYNLYLNKNQVAELFTNSKFGINIETWKIYNLLDLFNIKGFGFKTILEIYTSIFESNFLFKSILLIYDRVYNNENDDTYIIYNYKIWNNDISSIHYDKKDITEHNYKRSIKSLIKKKLIIEFDDDILCCYKDFIEELNIANNLLEFNKNESNLLNLLDDNLDDLIDNFRTKENEYELDNEQKEGIRKCFYNNTVIIYGKAGTGKSSMLEGLITILGSSKIHLEVFLLSPTHKAKNRLKEILENIEDRLSKNFDTIQGFIYKIKNNLKILQNSNIIIIDETSMVDNCLMNQLMNIINNNKIELLLFLGDDRQLPSIKKGIILNSMIESNIITSNKLKITHRYNKSKNLLNVLDKILNQLDIDNLDISNQFNWIDANINTDIIQYVLNNNIDIIITPLNNIIAEYTDIIRNIKNEIVEEINEIFINNYTIILKTNNNIIKEVQYNKKKFRINDDIIYNNNDNDVGLFNGLLGKIIDITNFYILVDFKTFEFPFYFNVPLKDIYLYDLSNFDEKKQNQINKINYIKYLDPAYMITVHKSQGQEYNNILIILPNHKTKILTNNLLYTAITRAKNNVHIISTKEILNYGVNRTLKRNSLLKDMLQDIDRYNEIIESSI